MSENAILSHRVAKILPTLSGLENLMSKRKIRLYQGFDPTGTRLHLGHAVGLKKLMEFAKLGHEVIFVFGTGTVLVGDPSQRNVGRILITKEEIEQNIINWKSQASKIVDFSKVTIKKNGDWLTKLSLQDIVRIASKVSANQLFKRESFRRRLEKGDTVWYHETMYPLLQGYDSVVMDVDLEIGGTDQEFNMLVGRELQRKINGKEKYVLTTPMILGIDGQQMSKSTGNCVWLDDSADEMFGKLMSMPDQQTEDYLELCTDLSEEKIKTAQKELKNPRDLKALMATEIVKIYYGAAATATAAGGFDAQFKDGGMPGVIEEVKLDKGDWDAADLLVKVELAESRSEAHRLINQGGVKINSRPLSKEPPWKLKSGDVIQVGKRKFVKIKL